MNITHIGHEMGSRSITGSLKDTGSSPTNLNKLGTGTLTISAQCTYTGITNVSNGNLTFSNSYIPSSIVLVSSNATLMYNNLNSVGDINKTIYGSGNLVKSSSGTLSFGGVSFNLDSQADIIVNDGGTLLISAGCNWANNTSDLTLSQNSIFRGQDSNIIVGCLSGYGFIQSGHTSGTYSYFTFGINNKDSIYQGSLYNDSARGNFRKVGYGNQTFTANNSANGYLTIVSGSITISAGILNNSPTILNDGTAIICISGNGFVGEYGPYIANSTGTLVANMNVWANQNPTSLMWGTTSNIYGGKGAALASTSGFIFGQAVSTGQYFYFPYELSAYSVTSLTRWYGTIIIPTAGSYTFYLASDDASMLWIDERLIINSNFGQSYTERNATITLTQGPHEIIYMYFNSGGGQGLHSRWTVGSTGVTIPTSSFVFGPYICSISGHPNSLIDASKVFPGYLNIYQKVDGNFYGIISGGNGCTIVKAGPGNLGLYNDNNNFTNLVLAGGRTTVNNMNIKGTNGPMGNGSLLRFWGGSLIYSGNSDLVYDKDISLLGNGIISVSGSKTTLSIIGQLSGFGSFMKAGTGTMVLSGNSNNHFGSTIISAGTMIIGTPTSLGRSDVMLGNNTNTYLDTNKFDNVSIGGLAGGGTTGGTILVYNNTVLIGSQSAASYTFSGAISSSGPVSLIKYGNHTQIFNTQSQKYSGTTTVSAGTLCLGYNGSGPGTLRSQDVYVCNNAVLSSIATNAFGYSGNNWITGVNILQGGMWLIQGTGDSCWGLTINMTGGTVATSAGVALSLGNGNSRINVVGTNVPSYISGSGTLTNRQTNLGYTISRGTSTYDLVLSITGNQHNIIKQGNGILYLPNNIISNISTLTTGGAVIFGGNYNTTTSSVQVASGEVRVIGAFTSGSTFTVADQGRLSGTGSISGSVIVNNSPGAIVQGGISANQANMLTVGQLTLSGASSKLFIATNGSNAISQIYVNNACSLGGCLADVSGALNTGTYVAIFAVNAITGSLPVLNANGTGRTVTFSISSGKVLNLIAS